MASYNELNFEWSMLSGKDCRDWNSSDLQLAAELGKTLLERNKELETSLKHHQNIIEDQAQEIEYLTKQNGALREVNDSRMKIYEQLEVSIQDLERDKYKLALENQSEKKHAKTLCRNIETLEAKVDELTKTLDEVRRLLDAEQKKNERLQSNCGGANGKAGRGLDGVLLRQVNSDGDDGNLSGPDEDEITEIDTSKSENFSFAFRDQSHSTDVTDGSHLGHQSSFTTASSQPPTDLNLAEENEELIRIMQELDKTRKCFIAEQNRVTELEEQLAAIAQENQMLQSKIVQINTTEEMKSVHEELSILDEVRQERMCTRCMVRGFEDRHDDESIITGTEDDDRSLIDLIQNTDGHHHPQLYQSTVTLKINSPKPDTLDLSGTSSNNPYRELVEKYEALLEVQRSSVMMRNKASGGNGGTSPPPPANAPNASSNAAGGATSGHGHHQPSLHEELGSGDFSSLNTKFTDEDGASSKKDDQSSNGTRRKIGLRTPTDFSETETTSSGFSDEISNKATQTDERPRNFLCTIADGEDCKFSIYEDQTAIDSRFRFSPSHRELFREIFTILKKAADNRDEGDQLPLLDDQQPAGGKTNAPKVPPVTPANEEPPSEFGDDTQSVISSAVSEQSFAMSECITKSERKKIEKQAKYAEKHGEQENKPPVGVAALPDGRILTPYKRQPLDYLTVSVGVNKKKSRRRRNRGSDADSLNRSDSPIALPTPPRVYATSGHKKGRANYRPWNPNASPSGTSSPVQVHTTPSGTAEWNGNSMTIYNRSINSPTPSPSANQFTPPINRGESTNTSAATSAGSANRSSNRFAELTDESGEIVQFKPSSASQDLHKLKKLDLSYAEVLRRADQCKHHNQRRHRNK
ncbi:uncharacterized protein LOC129740228 isoform X2 [Uranotaenia lowii]|uniref:uncharacterized protein LOC129740228 isoform X2 n=1 Tax=Uranotaenia lowii TaxID=190385 RepID=UPI00247AC9AB|nr:uncharacterized protein LOC129740228 isoform X2 [Uranotaenia lowii]